MKQPELDLTYPLEHSGVYSPKNYPGEALLRKAQRLSAVIGKEGEAEAFFSWDTDTIIIYNGERVTVRELPLRATLDANQEKLK